MKEIIISQKHIKRELWIFAVCIAVMEILNIYAIIKYDGMWIETVKSLGFVFIAALAAYAVIALVRILVAGIVKLIKIIK